MRDVTLSDIERLQAAADEADLAFEMDEDTFRAFYDRTARPLWAYLSRLTGDRQAADDLLQEAYYRFLRARTVLDSEAHRRNYLFRIATNLVRDGVRRKYAGGGTLIVQDDCATVPASGDVAADTERRADLHRAMAQLKPRERELLRQPEDDAARRAECKGADAVGRPPRAREPVGGPIHPDTRTLDIGPEPGLSRGRPAQALAERAPAAGLAVPARVVHHHAMPAALEVLRPHHHIPARRGEPVQQHDHVLARSVPALGELNHAESAAGRR